MKLREWLTATDTRVTDFAAAIGTSEVSVWRYLNDKRTPRASEMQKIIEATDGAVTPNDFFDIPGKAATKPEIRTN